MRPLVAGNWKMNGLSADLKELSALKAMLSERLGEIGTVGCDVVVCPPATLIAKAVQTVQGAFAIGAQDCHAQISGAFTGDIAAQMLKDAGASYVILGHSERRRHYGETNALIAAKVEAAWRAGLKVIVCIGESLVERQAGTQDQICRDQLAESLPSGASAQNCLVAYEPVWAIGTGVTPTPLDITAMHRHIGACLLERLGDEAQAIGIVYGGSVNPANAPAILNLPAVNGALVGGASLCATDFYTIIKAINPA